MPSNSNRKSSRKAKILPQFSISSGKKPPLDLLEIQRKSFFDLLERGIAHELTKTSSFRETTKNSVFTRELELVFNPETYKLVSPNCTPKQAILKGKTYACKLYVQATLTIRSSPRELGQEPKSAPDFSSFIPHIPSFFIDPPEIKSSQRALTPVELEAESTVNPTLGSIVLGQRKLLRSNIKNREEKLFWKPANFFSYSHIFSENPKGYKHFKEKSKKLPYRQSLVTFDSAALALGDIGSLSQLLTPLAATLTKPLRGFDTKGVRSSAALFKLGNANESIVEILDKNFIRKSKNVYERWVQSRRTLSYANGSIDKLKIPTKYFFRLSISSKLPKKSKPLPKLNSSASQAKLLSFPSQTPEGLVGGKGKLSIEILKQITTGKTNSNKIPYKGTASKVIFFWSHEKKPFKGMVYIDRVANFTNFLTHCPLGMTLLNPFSAFYILGNYDSKARGNMPLTLSTSYLFGVQISQVPYPFGVQINQVPHPLLIFFGNKYGVKRNRVPSELKAKHGIYAVDRSLLIPGGSMKNSQGFNKGVTNANLDFLKNAILRYIPLRYSNFLLTKQKSHKSFYVESCLCYLKALFFHKLTVSKHLTPTIFKTATRLVKDKKQRTNLFSFSFREYWKKIVQNTTLLKLPQLRNTKSQTLFSSKTPTFPYPVGFAKLSVKNQMSANCLSPTALTPLELEAAGLQNEQTSTRNYWEFPWSRGADVKNIENAPNVCVIVDQCVNNSGNQNSLLSFASQTPEGSEGSLDNPERVSIDKENSSITSMECQQVEASRYFARNGSNNFTRQGFHNDAVIETSAYEDFGLGDLLINTSVSKIWHKRKPSHAILTQQLRMPKGLEGACEAEQQATSLHKERNLFFRNKSIESFVVDRYALPTFVEAPVIWNVQKSIDLLRKEEAQNSLLLKNLRYVHQLITPLAATLTKPNTFCNIANNYSASYTFDSYTSKALLTPPGFGLRSCQYNFETFATPYSAFNTFGSYASKALRDMALTPSGLEAEGFVLEKSWQLRKPLEKNKTNASRTAMPIFPTKQVFAISQLKKRLNRPTLSLQRQSIDTHETRNVQIFRPWIFLGELPLMTKRGHFILNGSPRVIVNQIARCPGIYFQEKRRGVGFEQEVRVSADLIPQRGPWLRIQSDWEGRFWARLKQEGRVKYATLYETFQEFEKQYNAPLVNLVVNSSSLFPKSEIVGFQEKKAKEDRQKKALVRLFKNPTRYSLGKLGRLRMNQRVHFNFPHIQLLTPKELCSSSPLRGEELALSSPRRGEKSMESMNKVPLELETECEIYGDILHKKNSRTALSTSTTFSMPSFASPSGLSKERIRTTINPRNFRPFSDYPYVSLSQRSQLSSLTGINELIHSFTPTRAKLALVVNSQLAKSINYQATKPSSFISRRANAAEQISHAMLTQQLCMPEGLEEVCEAEQQTTFLCNKSIDSKIHKTELTGEKNRVYSHALSEIFDQYYPVRYVKEKKRNLACPSETTVSTFMRSSRRDQSQIPEGLASVAAKSVKNRVGALPLSTLSTFHPVGINRVPQLLTPKKSKPYGVKRNKVLSELEAEHGMRRNLQTSIAKITSQTSMYPSTEVFIPARPVPTGVAHFPLVPLIDPSTQSHLLTSDKRTKFKDSSSSVNELTELLMAEDIDAVQTCLERLLEGQGFTDDIDHLKNRFIRTSGKLLQQQFELGLYRLNEVITPLLNQLLTSVNSTTLSLASPSGLRTQSIRGTYPLRGLDKVDRKDLYQRRKVKKSNKVNNKFSNYVTKSKDSNSIDLVTVTQTPEGLIGGTNGSRKKLSLRNKSIDTTSGLTKLEVKKNWLNNSVKTFDTFLLSRKDLKKHNFTPIQKNQEIFSYEGFHTSSLAVDQLKAAERYSLVQNGKVDKNGTFYRLSSYPLLPRGHFKDGKLNSFFMATSRWNSTRSSPKGFDFSQLLTPKKLSPYAEHSGSSSPLRGEELDLSSPRRGEKSINQVPHPVGVKMNRVPLELEAEVKNISKNVGITPVAAPFRWLRTSKPVNGAFREFFGSNPLSQYMDQTNPLAEITHKRRLSSMGPGGIKRETAGMEVRGIHPTHYGRICPIETPEGKNAGLVNSPTVYSRIGHNGFMETPLYQVVQSQVQLKRWTFFSAQQEENEETSLATCDTGLKQFNLLSHVPIPVQTANNPLAHFQQVERNLVGYRALSPVQTISIATALIPFLEHDDANRALMGSNMQRQAIPLLLPERPIVGTGFEPLVIAESGQALQATKIGCVSHVSAKKILLHSIHSIGGTFPQDIVRNGTNLGGVFTTSEFDPVSHLVRLASYTEGCASLMQYAASYATGRLEDQKKSKLKSYPPLSFASPSWFGWQNRGIQVRHRTTRRSLALRGNSLQTGPGFVSVTWQERFAKLKSIIRTCENADKDTGLIALSTSQFLTLFLSSRALLAKQPKVLETDLNGVQTKGPSIKSKPSKTYDLLQPQLLWHQKLAKHFHRSEKSPKKLNGDSISNTYLKFFQRAPKYKNTWCNENFFSQIGMLWNANAEVDICSNEVPSTEPVFGNNSVQKIFLNSNWLRYYLNCKITILAEKQINNSNFIDSIDYSPRRGEDKLGSSAANTFGVKAPRGLAKLRLNVTSLIPPANALHFLTLSLSPRAVTPSELAAEQSIKSKPFGCFLNKKLCKKKGRGAGFKIGHYFVNEFPKMDSLWQVKKLFWSTFLNGIPQLRKPMLSFASPKGACEAEHGLAKLKQRHALLAPQQDSEFNALHVYTYPLKLAKLKRGLAKSGHSFKLTENAHEQAYGNGVTMPKVDNKAFLEAASATPFQFSYYLNGVQTKDKNVFRTFGVNNFGQLNSNVYATSALQLLTSPGFALQNSKAIPLGQLHIPRFTKSSNVYLSTLSSPHAQLLTPLVSKPQRRLARGEELDLSSPRRGEKSIESKPVGVKINKLTPYSRKSFLHFWQLRQQSPPGSGLQNKEVQVGKEAFSTFILSLRDIKQHKEMLNISKKIPQQTTPRLHLCSTYNTFLLKQVEQPLQIYQRSNQETCLSQRPLVEEGDWVQKGDFIADCSSSNSGDLALGKNVTVAYMPWEGYNFEDAIVISDRLVADDVYTSIHIERYEIKVSKNSQGKEKITNQIPGTSGPLKHLDNFGIARVSSWVQPGDILVGKVVELKRPLSPYERLAWELASRLSPTSPEREKWLNKVWLEDISLRLHSGVCGRVINSQIVSTEWSEKEQLAYPTEVHIYLAVKRKIQVGDKLAGRHGNKGIVSIILPREDMPYLGDGSSVDMVLNPLGVPSRMNLGQIFECLLGLAGSQLGCNFKVTPFDEIAGGEASRSLVFLKLYQCRLIYKQQWLFTPTFPGKSKLFDGRTGEPFENWVTVGQAYMLKLIHMVDHKIHARSTGPYSLFTRQPVRGRSRRGGQRLGEMEVWAVEGFGAAYTLQEFLTIKSDDLKARAALQRSFYKQSDVTLGKVHISPGNPEAFKVLVSELEALCLHIQM